MNREEESVIEQMDQLIRDLNTMRDEYYIQGTPHASDQSYDRVYDTLLGLEAAYPQLMRLDSPTQRVGSDLSADFPEREHTVPVLSLDKAYTEEAVISWMQRTEGKVEQQLSFIIEEKIDGVSIVLYYEDGLLLHAVTRGNGYVGNDVTANVRTIAQIPLRLPSPVSIAVRGEIYLQKDDFLRLNERMDTPYANPRNLAAGTLRRIRSSETAAVPLKIFVYEGFYQDPSRQPADHEDLLKELGKLGFPVNPRNRSFSSADSLTRYLEKSVAERETLPYEIDGLVIKIGASDVREALGYTGHHPRWALAYKFESPMAQSIVERIEVQIGRTGRVTPVARISPVAIGGSTVSNVTLHNQDYIDLLELAVGDTVEVSKRGDVIPAVERVTEKNEEGNISWKLPEYCPSCQQRLLRRGAHHFCTNHQCPDQIFGRLNFFVGRDQMDIEGLGSETIAVLIERKMVIDPADLYTADYKQLIDAEGFGEKKISQIEKGIAASRSQPYQVVLRSLGIPELGKRASQLLIEAGVHTIDQLIDISRAGDPESITSIHGFGEKTAKHIIDAFRDPLLLEQIDRLRAAGLNLAAAAPEEKRADLPFSGQSWCVTGSFTGYKPRSRAADLITENGGKVTTAVTGKTTHLLAGAKAGSKLKKAQSLGVLVISEEEFNQMLSQSGII